jgi:hypothetical protein
MNAEPKEPPINAAAQEPVSASLGGGQEGAVSPSGEPLSNNDRITAPVAAAPNEPVAPLPSADELVTQAAAQLAACFMGFGDTLGEAKARARRFFTEPGALNDLAKFALAERASPQAVPAERGTKDKSG